MEESRDSRLLIRLWRAVAILLALVSAILAGQSMVSSWGHNREAVLLLAEGSARALEGEFAGLASTVRLALQAIANVQERRLADEGTGERIARAFIADIDESFADVGAIRVSDASGRIVFRTDTDRATGQRIDAQPYFARLRDESGASIHISGPYPDGPDGRLVVDFARRIADVRGGFAGAVVVPVPLGRLASILAAAEVGKNGESCLAGEGLGLIAKHPATGTPGAGLPEALKNRVMRGEQSGSLVARSPSDGVERTYAFRRVASYPAYVVVARDTEQYFGHWRRDAVVLGAFVVLLLIVLAGSFVLLDRAWGRQEQAARLLEKQAHTDALTGVASRRRFLEMADAELARARRYDAPLSFLMLDIDHFKEVNDSFGHRAGDLVLQKLAHTSRDVLRNVDIVGRVGGEEFAFLLPETEAVGAVEVAERLREAVDASEVVRDDGAPMRITVSLGVAAARANDSIDTLMSRADAALYDAKHRGRNRVRLFGQED